MGCQGSPDPLDLAALFDPRVVAVLGASPDPAKWGHILARRALGSALTGRRRAVLVSRRAQPVLGEVTHPSLGAARDAVGAPLDLVVVCVPADGLVGAVTDAVGAGARAVVAITAGATPEAEASAVAVARAGGAVLVGPNCLGLADTGAGLQLAHAELPAGSVTVLSQSGNLVLDLADLLQDKGLGIARFVSLGNQAQVSVVDALASCRDHEGTRAIAVYAEDVIDGRGFVAVARELVAVGKPVVLLSPGRSEAAARTAVSHTGSLTSASDIVDAACAAAGVRRVDDPVRMADLLEGLLGERRLAGRRVAVVTDGGGHGAVAADALSLVGLDVPVLGADTQAAVGASLWATSAIGNPVDLAGAGDRDPTAYGAAVGALLAADDVDGVLLTGWFGGYSAESVEPGTVGAAELAAAKAMTVDSSVPVVVHTVFPDSPSARLLRAAGVPVHRDVGRAAAVLAGIAAVDPVEPVDMPAAEPPVRDVGYAAARELFAGAGIPFLPACTVTDAADLEAAAQRTGFPVVLKALGREHKSDAGGVVLGLADDVALRAAHADLVARLDPPAVSVEAMADTASGVEVIAGCVRDRTFGPVVMVGLGGIHAEVLADTACALAPVGVATARRLLLSLRASPLLTGVRGRPAVDLDALAGAVAALSRLAAAHPELGELEVNPLLALQEGCLALDARIVGSRAPGERVDRSRDVGS